MKKGRKKIRKRRFQEASSQDLPQARSLEKISKKNKLPRKYLSNADTNPPSAGKPKLAISY